MVRATRVANPLSRALGAGIGIGAMAAAAFLMANPSAAKPTPGTTTLVIDAKLASAS